MSNRLYEIKNVIRKAPLRTNFYSGPYIFYSEKELNKTINQGFFIQLLRNL